MDIKSHSISFRTTRGYADLLTKLSKRLRRSKTSTMEEALSQLDMATRRQRKK